MSYLCIGNGKERLSPTHLQEKGLVTTGMRVQDSTEPQGPDGREHLKPVATRASGHGIAVSLQQQLRQFGIILEQCYLFVVLNTISFDCLRFVVKEAICTDSRNEVHQEIVNGSVS